MTVSSSMRLLLRKISQIVVFLHFAANLINYHLCTPWNKLLYRNYIKILYKSQHQTEHKAAFRRTQTIKTKKTFISTFITPKNGDINGGIIVFKIRRFGYSIIRKLYNMIDISTQLYSRHCAHHLIECVFVSRQKRRLSFSHSIKWSKKLCGSNGASVFRAQAPSLAHFLS